MGTMILIRITLLSNIIATPTIRVRTKIMGTTMDTLHPTRLEPLVMARITNREVLVTLHSIMSTQEGRKAIAARTLRGERGI